MVTKEHKITNIPLIQKVCDVIFCLLAKQIICHFLWFFLGASTFFTPNSSLATRGLGVKKVIKIKS